MSEPQAFTIREIAEALGVDTSSAKRRAAREGWPYEERTGRGGTRRLYALAALPLAAQAALLKRHGANQPAPPALPAETAFTYDKEGLWTHYERASQKKKDEAQMRTGLLRQVMQLVESGQPWRTAAEAVAKAHGASAANLRNWYHGVNGRRGVKHYAPEDWLAAMVPGYTGRTATAECSPEAWNYFRADYLRLEKPTATACYERLQLAAREHGWTIPSLTTLERRIREIPLPVRVLMREGEHALMRLLPPLQRSVRDLHATAWINGDGYQHNVFVKWPDGQVERPKTWFWQDVYSRKFLTWRTDTTEHTDVIRLSFGDLVERFGIPLDVTIDNTRAAANKWMTGQVPNRYRFKIKEDDPVGIFPLLDIKVHWTSVFAGKGHGQAKPIERAFGVGGLGEYVDKHPALAGAYTGANPNAKPENYMSRAVPLEVFLQVLQEGVETWNAITKRKTEICGGVLSFNQAFEQSYATAPVRKATAEQRRLWMLAAEAVTVGKTGSITLDAGAMAGQGKNRYDADALLEFRGHKVVVRFDPDHLHESVHVYTLDGRYIGEAECSQAVGFGDTQAGREHRRALKQKIKATKQMAAAEQRMSALEAAALLPGVESPETKVVRPVFGKTPVKKVVGSDIEPGEENQTDLVESGDDFLIALWERKKKEIL